MPNDLYKSIDNKCFISLNELDTAKKIDDIIGYPLNGEGIINKGKPIIPYKLKHFTINSEIHKMKKVFISYSNRDISYLEELKIHLAPFNKLNIIETWDCTTLQSGYWHPQIQAKLKEADIVILMLSPYFLASEYICNEELLPSFIDIKENPEKKLIFVVVRNFVPEALSQFVTDAPKSSIHTIQNNFYWRR